MVREIHRLGKKAVVHARGREATLYSARAGVDLIFHANHLDDECIAAMLETGSMLSPTLTQPRNIIDFTQPHEPAGQQGPPRACAARIRDRLRQLEKGPRRRRAVADRDRYRFCGHPLWRMERPRARALRRRSRLHAGRRAARGDRGQCPLHDRGRPYRRAGARPRRRFHRARRLAARRHPRAAGQAAGCRRSTSPGRRSASPTAPTTRARSPISRCRTGPTSTPGSGSPNCGSQRPILAAAE